MQIHRETYLYGQCENWRYDRIPAFTAGAQHKGHLLQMILKMTQTDLNFPVSMHMIYQCLDMTPLDSQILTKTIHRSLLFVTFVITRYEENDDDM